MNEYLSADQIINKKKEFFFPNAMHFYKNPPHLVKGENCILTDDQGKDYIDFFAGVTVANCGHCNPEITQRVVDQSKRLQHTSIIYLTQPMVDLGQALAKHLPGDMKQTFFCCSGTEANEGALLLARMHTGRKAFLSFEGGLHGRSHLTMSLTGIPMWRIDPHLNPDVYFARGFLKKDQETQEEASRAALADVKRILEAHGKEIAACIIEPMQGNGGMHLPTKTFMKGLKEQLEAHGVLLIADEVQTGFGRTGKMFAMEHFEVIPDIMTMAKALGNGYPIGAFSALPHIAASFNKPSASTLGGNPVAMMAGLGVLSYLEKHELVEKANRQGQALLLQLEDLKNKSKVIKDVRGLGLMVGLELEGPDQVDRVLEEMKDRGFIIGKNGLDRNVLAFQPPLTISDEQISAMIKELDQVIKSLEDRG